MPPEHCSIRNLCRAAGRSDRADKARGTCCQSGVQGEGGNLIDGQSKAATPASLSAVRSITIGSSKLQTAFFSILQFYCSFFNTNTNNNKYIPQPCISIQTQNDPAQGTLYSSALGCFCRYSLLLIDSISDNAQLHRQFRSYYCRMCSKPANEETW